MERRQFDRETATIAAACRVRGIAYRARLSEVSQQGCCAEMARDVAAPGERVLLQLGSLLVLPAVVRWVTGERTGLEFAHPLHGAMLTQYALRQVEHRSDLH
ncbi:PilZ domain-containing protein [Novosphingobium sp. PS1R-30]|uniref:PilZ domain-containing protein n=1 Tax=Novosphingobium anseongense TaxID=3133436 RepID=A0ABU8RUS0_9SPHN